jgi:hypothetical protein
MEKMYNDEIYNIYTSPYIIRVIESGKMRWMGQAERVGGTRNSYNILIW